jgi:SNF2 family DNA or RNA helicase
MEMRLGKTPSVIWLQRKWPISKTHRHNIVLCPTTVIQTWEEQLYMEGEAYTVLQGLSPEKREQLLEDIFVNDVPTWVLSNYETVRVMPVLAHLPWRCTILDESTEIKNPQTQISKTCCAGFRNVLHRFVLSGSPTPESLMDVFQQMKFVYGKFLFHTNYFKFRNTYFEISPRTGKWEPKRGAATVIKKEIYDRAFVCSRKETGLGSVQIHEKRKVAMHPDQQKLYNQIEAEFAADFMSYSGEQLYLETEYAIVKATWLARVAGGSTPGQRFEGETIVDPRHTWDNKPAEMLKLLRGELSNQQVVVWYRFNEEIRGTKDTLNRHGIPFASITGESTREERQGRIGAFRHGKAQILLCQVKCAKFGLDCSCASTAIYYSMTYSSLEISQSRERILHPSKKEPLLYLYLLSDGTIDEDVYHAASKKVMSSRAFMEKMQENLVRRVHL